MKSERQDAIQKEIYLNTFSLEKNRCLPFFQKIMDGLHVELQHLSATFFAHENTPKYLFALNEATWVGLLNNVIIRVFGENVTSLQEMGIYKKKPTYIGRADYMVYWKEAEGSVPIAFLFEAKQYEELSKAKILESSSVYLENVKKQAYNYFIANPDYYNNARVFIVPIIFGWIKKEGFMEEAKKYFNNKRKDDVDFCSLYYYEDQGVWVYGSIFEIEAGRDN